jgi:predicted outer membrane lipoprotein
MLPPAACGVGLRSGLAARCSQPSNPVRRRWILGVLLAGVVAVAVVFVLSVKHLQAKAAGAQREEVAELNLARAVEKLNGLEWAAFAKSHLSGDSSKTAAAVIARPPVLARRRGPDLSQWSMA